MSGLTVEDVNAMQDEMFKIGDGEDGAGDASADATKVADDTAKLAEAKAVEDAAKLKADEEAAAKLKEAEGSKAEEIDIVRELKEQVRTSNAALQKATSDYQRLHKIMVDKGVITEEEVEADKAAEATARAAFTERQSKLLEMVTIMELNPTYADVRTVCSQGNIDDVVDAFARFYVKENGGNLQETAAKMEAEIWAEANPYKKIYELVKKYHPKYRVVEETDEQKKAKEAEEAAKKIAADADKTKDKVAVDATPSAANIGSGGSGTGGGGWTAAKIDALPEEELSTVPKDIYEKYLQGTLT